MKADVIFVNIAGGVNVIKFFKKVFYKRCPHKHKIITRTIYGDMINAISSYRQVYRYEYTCLDCGKVFYSE